MPSFDIAFREEEWRDIDLSILEEKRAAVPAFPLDLLPQPWRDWAGDTACATGAPADYVVQSLLAALGGLAGGIARVRITPAWSEPLVLWLAAVGEASTGKSSALAPMRRLLLALEKERRLHDDDRREAHAEQMKAGAAAEPFVPSQIVVPDAAPETIAAIVSGNARGVVQWRDGPSAWSHDGAADGTPWLAAWDVAAVTIERSRGQAPLGLAAFPVSRLVAVQPARLKETLGEGDDGGAARFLYAWPGLQPYRALADLRLARDDEALALLRRLARFVATPEAPLTLVLDPHGIAALDDFRSGLHVERSKAEGLEAAWLGKGAATVARLAGALELLAWMGGGATGQPGQIGAAQVEAAAALWTDYFRPHARAVFDCAVPSTFSRRVKRVVRWLKDSRAGVVSREDVRCQALARTVNADDAQQVLHHLGMLGFVRPDRADDGGGRGRPARRWQVNPALAEA